MRAIAWGGLRNLAQALRHLDQVLVAHFVAQSVVEVLELVQVEQQQRAVPVVLAAVGQCRLHALAQQVAIGQAGQRVVVGQPVDGLLVGRKALLHPLQVGQQRGDFVVSAHHDGGVKPTFGNVVEHARDLAQRVHDGADQHHPQKPEHAHGEQQGAHGQGAGLIVALHAGAVFGLRMVELQVDQGLDMRAGAVVERARLRGQALGVVVVGLAQRRQGRQDGGAQVLRAVAGKLLGQRGLGRALGAGGVGIPQLVDGRCVALDHAGRPVGKVRVQAPPHGWGRCRCQRHFEQVLVGQHHLRDLAQGAHGFHPVLVHHMQALVGSRQALDARGGQQGADQRRQHHHGRQARADAKAREKMVSDALWAAHRNHVGRGRIQWKRCHGHGAAPGAPQRMAPFAREQAPGVHKVTDRTKEVMPNIGMKPGAWGHGFVRGVFGAPDSEQPGVRAVQLCVSFDSESSMVCVHT